MRIQHNIPALNSHRNLGINNAATSKNLEKLSSGYRINRAGDDAAGLAISEKMRGQIRGLAMAEQNTSMGINLIQTAEGGLNETHAILQRMRELAVQSSNGTYQDSDRTQLTHEFEALMEEIDRIAESTHYNGIKLLDGSLGSSNAVPKVSGQKANGEIITSTDNTPEAAEFVAAGLDVATLANGDKLTFNVTDANGAAQTIEVTLSTIGTLATKDLDLAVDLQGSDLANYFDIAVAATGEITLTAKTTGTNKETYVGATLTPTSGAATTTLSRQVTNPGVDPGKDLDLADAVKFEIDGKKFQFVNEGGKADSGYEAIYVNDATDPTADMTSIIAQLTDKGYNVGYDDTATPASTVLTFFPSQGKDLVFQIGANGGADQRVSLSVDDMSSKSIGLQDKNGNLTNSLASASIDSVANANAAIDIIDAATDMVSAQRAKLGALQNRLEHTMNNLGVTKENLTASESTIRDVDMASEMMEYTKNSILIQASQAMLAQANQLPQGVLQLLR